MPPYHVHREEDGLTQAWLLDRSVLLHGGSWTPNFLAWPSAADVRLCSLSEVLERGNVPTRFFLSSKACAGILRRAAKRQKLLPEALRRALEQVAGPQA